MIVFPLNLARDLIDELGVAHVSACFSEGTFVAALQKWVIVIVEEATAGEASLLCGLGAEDVQDENISGHLLVLFDLDNVASLQGSPVAELKRAVALVEDELFDRLVVDSLGSFAPLSVCKRIHGACHDDRDGDRGDDMRVLTDLVHATHVHKHQVE